MRTKTQNGPAVKIEPRKVTRSVKHVYNATERQALGDELAHQIGNMREIEAEFEHVKAGFKARSAAAEAMVNKCSTALTSGFEYRDKPCLMYLHPPTKKRYLYLEAGFQFEPGLLDINDPGHRDLAHFVEDMQPQDFQQELAIVDRSRAVATEPEPEAV